MLSVLFFILISLFGAFLFTTYKELRCVKGCFVIAFIIAYLWFTVGIIVNKIRHDTDTCEFCVWKDSVKYVDEKDVVIEEKPIYVECIRNNGKSIFDILYKDTSK